MVVDQAIDGLRIKTPESAMSGTRADLRVAIMGDDGQPMRAIVPVKIEVFDPSGRAAEFSGYYGAKDGVVELKLDIAPNDMPGLWRIHVQELASNQTADAYMRVTPAKVAGTLRVPSAKVAGTLRVPSAQSSRHTPCAVGTTGESSGSTPLS